MNCSVCHKPIEPKHSYLCVKCFWDTPAPLRMKLGHLHRMRQPVDALLAKIVRTLRPAADPNP